MSHHYMEDTETYEQRRERWEKEDAIRLEKATKLFFEKYKGKRKAEIERDRDGGYTEYTYDEGTKETDKEVKSTRRIFRVQGGKVTYTHTSTTTQQKFLVVNGPLKGQRITDTNEDYVLFNRNGRWGKNVPKCVLVHAKAFET